MVWVVPDLSVKSADRGNCELKRLACSVNYDIKGGHSNRVKGASQNQNGVGSARFECKVS
jgi:hypothetical protein